jgi:Flp pilus assembly protein TadB
MIVFYFFLGAICLLIVFLFFYGWYKFHKSIKQMAKDIDREEDEQNNDYYPNT